MRQKIKPEISKMTNFAQFAFYECHFDLFEFPAVDSDV